MLEISRPSHPIQGEVNLPSSKSISNRQLILSYLSGDKTVLKNLSESDDTRLLQKALDQIRDKSKHIIDVGHAGTDFRFLTALLACKEGAFELTGSERLKERPVKGLVDALRMLGAEINYLNKEGYPPLRINGKQLKGHSVTLDASSSSQFVSALMLAFPLLDGDLTILIKGEQVSKPYIEMTISILKSYGIAVHQTKNEYRLSGKINPPQEIEIEGDWSSASYFYSICALSPGSRILLRGLNKHSLQGDSVLEKLYIPLGVNTIFREDGVLIEYAEIGKNEFRYDFKDCPDLAQTVALTCAAQGRQAYLTGLQTLRLKETDRIKALASELNKIGCRAQEQESALLIEGGPLKSTDSSPIKTYDDHRMAMSFAPLALKLGAIKIEDPEVVGKSYPGFWSDLRSLGFNVNLQPR